MIERPAEAASSYGRLRLFLETEELGTRRLTAEWLAGRLILPLGECTRLLDRLAGEGLLRRHRSADAPAWFEVVPPSAGVDLRQIVRGAVVLAVSTAVVALSTLVHHVFFFAGGLALGLMIAFAWLDWELGSRGEAS